MTINRQLNKFYTQAGLNDELIRAMPAYIAGKVEFYDTLAYKMLYKYFAFETLEMPLGTAKSRDGDPDCWILDYLECRLHGHV